jgi:hypothetical protein
MNDYSTFALVKKCLISLFQAFPEPKLTRIPEKYEYNALKDIIKNGTLNITVKKSNWGYYYEYPNSRNVNSINLARCVEQGWLAENRSAWVNPDSYNNTYSTRTYTITKLGKLAYESFNKESNHE